MKSTVIAMKTISGFIKMSYMYDLFLNKHDPAAWKRCGVYCIKNKINNKVYIGSSHNMYKRFRRHLNELRKNKHGNTHLQNAFLKYGEGNFYICIFDYCLEDSISLKEQFYMDLLGCTNISCGYNIRPKADNRLMAEETKKKLSVAHTGKKLSEETKKKLSYIRKGRPSYLKGTKLSEGHKQKIKDNARTNPNYGFKGKKHTEESLKKISQSSTGRLKSEESKAKQSAQIKGRKYSIAHRSKMSQAQRKRWERYRLDKLKENIL